MERDEWSQQHSRSHWNRYAILVYSWKRRSQRCYSVDVDFLSDATNTFESIEYEADGSAGQDFFQVIEANAAFTATSDTTSPNPAAQNSPVIVEFTADQTIPSAQTNIWINGVLGAQNRIVDQNVTGGFQNLRYWLGMNFNIPAQGWKGVISENFAYIGLLTAQQRKNLYRAYLGQRYKITVP